jgi:hypothetical protein
MQSNSDLDYLDFLEKNKPKIKKKSKKVKTNKIKKKKKTPFIERKWRKEDYELPRELQSSIRGAYEAPRESDLYLGINQEENNKMRRKYKKLFQKRTLEERLESNIHRTEKEPRQWRKHRKVQRHIPFISQYEINSMEKYQQHEPQRMSNSNFNQRRFLDFEDPEIHQPIFLNKFNSEVREEVDEHLKYGKRKRRKKLVTSYKQDKFKANQKSIKRVGIDLSEFVKDTRSDRVYVLKGGYDSQDEVEDDRNFDYIQAISVDEDDVNSKGP